MSKGTKESGQEHADERVTLEKAISRDHRTFSGNTDHGISDCGRSKASGNWTNFFRYRYSKLSFRIL